MSAGASFDRIADEYDRHRPTYPDELVDAVCKLAGLSPGDPVIEIGCGSGQLTLSLVARGLQVTAVEPGANLRARAQEKLARTEESQFPVTFLPERFEDAPLPQAHFRAVFCAAAFHWLDPDVSWRKAAEVLVPSGTLALIQHCAHGAEGTDEQALFELMERVSSELAAEWPRARTEEELITGTKTRAGNVSEAWAWVHSYELARDYAAALFDEVRLATVPVPMRHTAQELNAILATISYYQRLSAAERHDLERELEALQQRLGRPLRSSALSVALTARRTTY